MSDGWSISGVIAPLVIGVLLIFLTALTGLSLLDVLRLILFKIFGERWYPMWPGAAPENDVEAEDPPQPPQQQHQPPQQQHQPPQQQHQPPQQQHQPPQQQHQPPQQQHQPPRQLDLADFREQCETLKEMKNSLCTLDASVQDLHGTLDVLLDAVKGLDDSLKDMKLTPCVVQHEDSAVSAHTLKESTCRTTEAYDPTDTLSDSRDARLIDNSVKKSPPALTPENPTSAVKESHKSSVALEDVENEYWMVPTVEELEQMSPCALNNVHKLKVGRIGYGTLQFMGNIDLTTVDSLAAIPGKLIKFKKKAVVVYPKGCKKPTKVGEGFNGAPAKVTLEGCYPISMHTGMPVKDVSHELHKMHLERLQKVPDTKFVSYDEQTGDWTFTVENVVQSR